MSQHQCRNDRQCSGDPVVVPGPEVDHGRLKYLATAPPPSTSPTCWLNPTLHPPFIISARCTSQTEAVPPLHQSIKRKCIKPHQFVPRYRPNGDCPTDSAIRAGERLITYVLRAFCHLPPTSLGFNKSSSISSTKKRCGAQVLSVSHHSSRSGLVQRIPLRRALAWPRGADRSV